MNTIKEKDKLPEVVQGISLERYAAMSYYLAGDIDPEMLFSEVGIDRRLWNEIDREWRRSMENDASFILITRYSQYYNEADKYLKLDILQ